MTQRLDYRSIAPDGAKAFMGVSAYLARCGLPKILIDLVFVRTSQINGCAHCIDLHSHDLLKEGLSVDKLLLVPVWREAGSLFDERERAALLLAESVTNVATTGIPDADFEVARRVFSDKELADLFTAIAIMNAYNRIGVGFRAAPGALTR
ncbi:carboxymuconolactone decarboxylase family protein [Polyangium aurulentum]|uniref:carboxymuconolactone decarboxylase family protein n=1 Tax=Polyangium aurulentum TaxID=2567896 RepID=UPI0010AE1C26|nr:carboxymuconolactone decarboxylase family protein [Polyangium aurulentum]UQA57860.1 carboxymuconolactone decarboxylase family protein [Polyangium aurulentum]